MRVLQAATREKKSRLVLAEPGKKKEKNRSAKSCRKNIRVDKSRP